jgi:hypothetical protein
MQLGVQRYDHIKHLWAKIKHIQNVASEYESIMSDPDKMVDFAAVRIQSLARGKLDRHRVADIKQARLEKQQELFEHTAEGVLLEVLWTSDSLSLSLPPSLPLSVSLSSRTLPLSLSRSCAHQILHSPQHTFMPRLDPKKISGRGLVSAAAEV